MDRPEHRIGSNIQQVAESLPATSPQQKFMKALGMEEDLASSVSKDEAEGLIDQAITLRNRHKRASSGEIIKEKGLQPGTKVMSGKEGPFTVKSVFPDTGIVRLRERKGSFNPEFLDVVPD